MMADYLFHLFLYFNHENKVNVLSAVTLQPRPDNDACLH